MLGHGAGHLAKNPPSRLKTYKLRKRNKRITTTTGIKEHSSRTNNKNVVILYFLALSFCFYLFHFYNFE